MLKQIKINRDQFSVFKLILETRLNRKFTTDNSAITYFMNNFSELLYPDFEKYFKIETRINASLMLSAHHANHHLNEQIYELNLLSNCINIMFLKLVGTDIRKQYYINKELSLKRLIAYQYDKKTSKGDGL